MILFWAPVFFWILVRMHPLARPFIQNKLEKDGPDWKARYMAANNTASVDGLPAYEPDRDLATADLAALSSGGKAL